MAMYTFNLLSLDATMNNKSASPETMPSKLNTEECSIKELKARIAQMLSMPDDSFGRMKAVR